MGVLILKRNTDGGIEYLEKLCYYLKFNRKTKSIRDDFVIAFGSGVDADSMEDAYFQMMQVRKYFRKTGGNPLLHYIFSFDKRVKDEEAAIRYSRKIIAYFQDKYQVICAIHHKEREYSHYHVHIVVNSVSYVDGRMIDSYLPEIEKFRKHIAAVTMSLVPFHFAGYQEDVSGH